MQYKICKKCGEKKVKKDGYMRGKQRYRCGSCGYVFQNSSRKGGNMKLWKEYTSGKQTYKQLSDKYKLSIPTIQKQLDNFSVKKKS